MTKERVPAFCGGAPCIELWDGVYAVLKDRDSTRAVELVVLQAGEYPETVASIAQGTSWEKARRAVEKVARMVGVCDGWKAYDACIVEEVGRVTEIVLGLLGDP